MTAHRTKLLLLLVVVAACSRAPAAQQTGANTTLYRPDAVTAWLDCIECTPAQLEAVRKLGDSGVPEFRGVLLTGPTKERIEKQRQYLETRYRAVQEYQHQHPQQPAPQPQDEYVRMYLDRFVMLNRLRSARALGAIGTPAATEALKQAMSLQGIPDELRKEIRIALAPGK